MRNRSSTKAVAVSLALLALGFSLGWFSHSLRSAGDPAGGGAVGPQAQSAVSPESRSAGGNLPRADVPGNDLATLPRYPNSVRTKYEQTVDGNLSVTEVKYLSDMGLNSVREFYRSMFEEEGWMVADMEYSQSDWEFFLLDGKHEAVVELEPQDGSEKGLVEIEYDLSQPRPQG